LVFNVLICQNISFATSNKSNTLTEVKEKRTKYKKVFIDESNDLYIEKIYSNSIHYKDKKGFWEDIDNNISSSAQKNDQYTNDVEKNNYKLHLNKRSDKGLKITYQDMFIKYTALNTNKKEAEIVKNEVIYKNAWHSSDLQYISQNDGIKMNIILKDKNAPKKFEFEINSNNLIISQDTNGIRFQDKRNNQNVFTIPKMWVTDSSNPNKLRYDRVKEDLIEKNGKTIISITLDDKNLSYPLVIDPTTNLDSYGKVTDYSPATLVSENLTTPILAQYITNITIAVSYADPRSGPQDTSVNVYANKNAIPNAYFCYSSCIDPTQNASLGAVKISNYSSYHSISNSQLVAALGTNTVVNGLTLSDGIMGHYSITVVYTKVDRPLLPTNVKVERINDYQLKISWDISELNRNYKILDAASNTLITTTNNNYVVINKTTQDRYSLIAVNPSNNTESDKLSIVYDPLNTITFYYINNRLDKVTDLKKNESIKYEYAPNGNLLRKYKITS
jgi:hypothetical protein